MEKIKICCISESNHGVYYHRLEIPFGNLDKVYKDLEITFTNAINNFHEGLQYDIIFLNRYCNLSHYEIKKLKGKVKIIIDIDDYWNLPTWHSSYCAITSPIFEKALKENIELADEIWCASEYLKLKIKEVFNKESFYIPNGIDFDQQQFNPIKEVRLSNLPTIGYIAAANHHRDINKIAKAVYKIVHKPNFNILVSGYNEQSKKYWGFVDNVFTGGGILKNIIRIGSKDVYNYAVAYNAIDTALAPLCNDEFSKCKSNLKILEAGAFGLNVIASVCEPYQEFIDKGLIKGCSNDKEWDVALNKAIKDKSKNERLRTYVKENYSIEKINKLRYERIRNIVG